MDFEVVASLAKSAKNCITFCIVSHPIGGNVGIGGQ